MGTVHHSASLWELVKLLGAHEEWESMSEADYLPPTPAQIRLIARLSASLGIREPRVETMAEAGKMIRELREEREFRRVARKR